jgi:hypothetical protein
VQQHSLNRISDKNNTKNSRNHETHTSKLHEAKAAAKPKQKHAQQESFQTPQQTQLN